jgi:predicted CopG family antitoxin
MSTMTTVLKRIAVSEENYRKLQKLGDAGDSFNDVISRLIEGAAKKK